MLTKSLHIFTSQYAFIPWPHANYFLLQDPLGILNLAGIRSNSPAALHATAHRRGRNNYDALPFRTGHLPSAIYSQLDISIFRRRLFRTNFGHCWHYSDYSLFGLFLDLLYQVRFFFLSWFLGRNKLGFEPGPYSSNLNKIMLTDFSLFFLFLNPEFLRAKSLPCQYKRGVLERETFNLLLVVSEDIMNVLKK